MWLQKYREAIRTGEIIAGRDMVQELDNLITDLDDPQYRYDTTDSDMRISFIEGCIRLTKAPFYGAPMRCNSVTDGIVRMKKEKYAYFFCFGNFPVFFILGV